MGFVGFGSWGCLGTLIFEFGDVWIGFWKVLKRRKRGKMASSGSGPGPSLKKEEEVLSGGWAATWCMEGRDP